VQINPAVQSHRRSLLCVTTQATREGNPSRAEGPVRGISFTKGHSGQLRVRVCGSKHVVSITWSRGRITEHSRLRLRMTEALALLLDWAIGQCLVVGNHWTASEERC